MIVEPKKDYEQAEQGEFLGTVVDVIDLGPQPAYDGKIRVQLRILWVLGLVGGKGAYALDSEGNPFRVMRQVNASIDEKSTLYDIAKSVLGTAPPVPFDSEILIGKSNKLFLARETSKKGKVYANIKYIAPLPPGEIPPAVPQGFVRAKDKPKQTFPSNGAPAVQASAAGTIANTPTTGGAAPAAASTPDAAF